MPPLTRWIVILMFSGSLALGTDAPQEPEGLELRIRNAIELDSQGVPSLIQLLQRSAKTEKPTTEDQLAFLSGFRSACRKAEPTHYPLLAEVFTALPIESMAREMAHAEIATLALRRELEQLPASIEVSFPPEEPLPHSLPAHPELAAAWQQFLTVQAPFAALKTAAAALEKRPGFYSHRASYWKATDDLLLNRAPVKAEEFLAYQWDGGCCIIGDIFFDPTSIMATIALIREQRCTEAVGAMLDIHREIIGIAERDPFLKKFLLLCRQDPEPLLAGALAARDVDLTPEPSYRRHFSFRGTRTDLLHALSEERSPRSAKFIMDIATMAKPGPQQEYVQALSMFLKEDNHPSIDRIMTGLGFIALKKTSIETITCIAQTLGSCPERPGAKPLLRYLLNHPSASVSEAAYTALKQWGEPVEKPNRSATVQFLIRVNGAPLQDTTLRWAAKEGQNTLTSAEFQTGADGVGSIPRDLFLDPQKPLSTLIISTKDGTSPTDPLFAVEVPIPKTLDGVHPVEISTASLDLKIVFPRGPSLHQSGPMSVQILPVIETPPLAYLRLQFEVPTSDSIKLTGLQKGKYKMIFNAPAAAQFQGDFNLTESATFTAKLEIGAEIQVRVIPPEPWHPAWVSCNILTKDGKEPTFTVKDTGCYQGLPAGDYILRIPPSASLRSWARRLPLGVDYEGTELTFRIDAKSPPILDLGEIRLKGKKAEPPPPIAPVPPG